MSKDSAYRVILSLLSPDEWRQVPEFTERSVQSRQDKTRQYTRRYRIGGRQARLRELMDAGYIHVRTASFSPWFSQSSDPHPKYDRQQWQAKLTPQGVDYLAVLS